MIFARKRFGQHFLHDRSVLDRIVREIAPTQSPALVEIGPGRGALTDLLLDGPYASFDAVEIDRDLAGLLRPRFLLARAAQLHETDALELDVAALAQARGGKLRVIGNLPYNISTPLLFHLIGAASSVIDLHIMLQREVIARMAAEPGSDDYGRLTIMLYPWVCVEKLFDIGPGAFVPAPKVWSAVARVTVRAQPAFVPSPNFAQVVLAAFNHRSKTLRNCLKGLLDAAQIEACGVDPGARPETLSPRAFNDLALVLDQASATG